MGVLGGNTVRLCFGMGPGSGAAGLLIGSLCLASGLSCWHDGVLGCPVC
jgi:hypothetical protein